MATWTPPRRFTYVHTGLEYVPAPRRVALIRRVIDEFLERGDPVYKSRDWHPPTTKHFKPHGIWPIHCVQNTPGAEFHPQLKDDPRIHVISKGLGDTDCYSSFDETDLARQTARALGLPFKSALLPPERVTSGLDECIWAMDEPTVDGVNSFWT